MDGVALKAVCAGSQIEPTAGKFLEKPLPFSCLGKLPWVGPQSAVRGQSGERAEREVRATESS